MAGNTNKGVRHPETGDLMTEEKLNAFNLAKFKKSLKEGTLGNTGPLTSGGTSFSPGRWEKYFKENPEQAEKVGWSPSDTIKSYMSRSKNRKTTPVEEPEKQESEKQESEKEGIEDIDTKQDTDSKPLKEVGVPNELEGEVEVILGGDVTKDDDGNFIKKTSETRDQQKARINKEIEERNKLIDKKAEERVRKRKPHDKTHLKDKVERSMLTKKPLLDDKQVKKYLGILEKAGVKGARAEKLVNSLLSMCKG